MLVILALEMIFKALVKVQFWMNASAYALVGSNLSKWPQLLLMASNIEFYVFCLSFPQTLAKFASFVLNGNVELQTQMITCQAQFFSLHAAVYYDFFCPENSTRNEKNCLMYFILFHLSFRHDFSTNTVNVFNTSQPKIFLQHKTCLQYFPPQNIPATQNIEIARVKASIWK